jgi:hypothetical protein
MQGLGLAQAQGPGKKRYSSSFSKRYSVTGGSGSGVGGTGSEGSVGSGGEKKDGERVAVGVSIQYYLFSWSGFLHSISYACFTLFLVLITDYIHLFYLFV